MAWLFSVPLCRLASSPPLPPWSLTLSWQWHVLLFLQRDGKQLYAQLENIFRYSEDGLVTAAARPAYEIFGKPFLWQGVLRPFSSAALLVLPDGRQWHRRAPPPPLSRCCWAPSLRTQNAFHFLSAEPVGAAGLRRNIAERLRNVELEPFHVLAEAACSSIPASLPAPPAWLYGSAGGGPLPADSLLAKIGCRSFLSIADPAPSLLRPLVGSSPHRSTPFCGGSELAVPGRDAQAHRVPLWCTAGEGGCWQALPRNLPGPG